MKIFGNLVTFQKIIVFGQVSLYYHVTTFDDFRPTLREYFITQVHVTKRTKQTKEKLTKANDNGFSSNDNDTIRVVGLWDPTPKVAN